MPRLAAFPKGFFDDIVARKMTVFQWIEHAATL
ncbi:MAG: sugar phosphate isomerase/epimerase, partial [Planctomycetaceae bacterium]|nr:sugar phosphate isomerase/epimerase [Planctomycetaceae bacterium]